MMFLIWVWQVRSPKKFPSSSAQHDLLEHSQLYEPPKGVSAIDIGNTFAMRT